MLEDFPRVRRFLRPPQQEEAQEVGWQPAADIYRTTEGWLLKIELAGVREEEIHVSRAGRRLLVTGMRRDWAIEERGECYSMEISYCRFERRFELPCDLRRARIGWEYRDGMLLVRVITEVEEP